MSTRLNKEKDKVPHHAQLNHIEPMHIKCPNCGNKATNDPNNKHEEAYNRQGDKLIRFRTVRERRFLHYYFCTKCTRCTRVD
jgi:predicted RNA-binding Zn-ribbon protein involved in translation (DUF1610 family)